MLTPMTSATTWVVCVRTGSASGARTARWPARSPRAPPLEALPAHPGAVRAACSARTKLAPPRRDDLPVPGPPPRRAARSPPEPAQLHAVPGLTGCLAISSSCARSAAPPGPTITRSASPARADHALARVEAVEPGGGGRGHLGGAGPAVVLPRSIASIKHRADVSSAHRAGRLVRSLGSSPRRCAGRGSSRRDDRPVLIDAMLRGKTTPARLAEWPRPPPPALPASTRARA